MDKLKGFFAKAKEKVETKAEEFLDWAYENEETFYACLNGVMAVAYTLIGISIGKTIAYSEVQNMLIEALVERVDELSSGTDN